MWLTFSFTEVGMAAYDFSSCCAR